jgi:hypothetical protein
MVHAIHLGPLHTRAKSRNHESVGAQKKVSNGRSKTRPISCGLVTDSQVECEVICDRTLNQMLFQETSFHVDPHT